MKNYFKNAANYVLSKGKCSQENPVETQEQLEAVEQEPNLINDTFVNTRQKLQVVKYIFEPELYDELYSISDTYNNFYTTISNLETDYLAKQTSGSRLDAVKFITSIQTLLLKPLQVSQDLNSSELNLKINMITKAYHTLVGACLYTHQSIKDDYKDSWSVTLFGNSESSSQLFKLLDKKLSTLTQEVKQLSINQLKINFISDEFNELNIFPLDKDTNMPETQEKFIKNIDRCMNDLCPEDLESIATLSS